MNMNRIKRVALPLFGATALIAVAGCASLSDEDRMMLNEAKTTAAQAKQSADASRASAAEAARSAQAAASSADRAERAAERAERAFSAGQRK